jgi:hypothetical protein
MARRNVEAPKSASFSESCPIDAIPAVGGPVDAISTVGVDTFGETAEYFTSAVARLSFSPSAVKFWTTWVVPAKSTTAIKRSGDAVFSTNWFAARRACIWSPTFMVESSKKSTI